MTKYILGFKDSHSALQYGTTSGRCQKDPQLDSFSKYIATTQHQVLLAEVTLFMYIATESTSGAMPFLGRLPHKMTIVEVVSSLLLDNVFTNDTNCCLCSNQIKFVV